MEWIPGDEIEQSRIKAIQLAKESLGFGEKNNLIMKSFFENI
jgi:hypothetical protein